MIPNRARARLRRRKACHATNARAGIESHQVSQVAGVVDGPDGAAGEALLVEPDRLQVGWPGPPGRGSGVRRPQVVVVVVHVDESGRAASARRGPAASRERSGSRGRPTAGTRRRRRRPGSRAGRAPPRRSAGRPASPGAASPAAPDRRARAGSPGRPAPAAGRAARGPGVRRARTPRRPRRRAPSARPRRPARAGPGPADMEARPSRAPADGRPADGDPDLLHGPGHGMEDGHRRRDQGQGDHEEQEEQVAAGRRLGAGGDGHVAEGRRDRRQADHDEGPPQGRAEQDQEPDAADRVQGNPLRGKGQPEEDPDDGQAHPEGARQRHAPVQIVAKSVTAATMKSAT